MAPPEGMTKEIYDLYAGRLGFSALGMQGIGNEAADRVTNPKAKEIWARFEHLAKTNKDVANAAIDAYQKNPNEYASVIYSLAGNMDLNPAFAEKFVSGLEQDPKMASSVFSNYARELDRGTLGDYIHLVMTGSRPTSPIADKSETPQDELDTFLAKQGNEKFRDLVDKNQLRPLMKEEIGKNKSLMKSLYDPGQMAHYLDVLKKNEGSTLDVRQTAFMKAFAPTSIDMGSSLKDALGGEGLGKLFESMGKLSESLPPELKGIMDQVVDMFDGFGKIATGLQRASEDSHARKLTTDPVYYAKSLNGRAPSSDYLERVAAANAELARSNNPHEAQAGRKFLEKMGLPSDQIALLKNGGEVTDVRVKKDPKGKVLYYVDTATGSEADIRHYIGRSGWEEEQKRHKEILEKAGVSNPAPVATTT